MASENLEKLVIEWRDAREAILSADWSHTVALANKALLARLIRAEDTLMAHARMMERPICVPGGAKPTMLTPRQVTVLEAALAAEPEPLTWSQAVDLGHGESAWAILDSLKRAGCMEHQGYNAWRITEKGRIAVALYRAVGLAEPVTIPAAQGEPRE